MSGATITDFGSYLKNNILKVIVKPSAPETKITKYDSARQALRIDIAAPPDKDKANKELIKFLNKLTKKKASIISGAKSREKLLKFS